MRQLGRQIIDQDELTRARDEADTANRVKSEFLANMSHEIRTPLNGMLGVVQLLERDQLSAHQETQVKRLRHAADSLLAIISDILDFSKIEAGQLALESIPFDPELLLEQTLDLAALTAERKGLSLSFDLPPDLPARLIGDPMRISQVLHNLLGNAIKFTAQGSIRLQLRAVPTSASGVLLSIGVTDTGIGMTPAQQDYLFQPFQQADTSITRRFGGTGLGLVICKRLTEAMGGRISVDSTPGQGSTFHLALPLTVAASTEPETRRALWARRILLVDDNAERRLVTLGILNDFGDEVMVADTIDAATALLADPAQRLDIVLLDSTSTPRALELAQCLQTHLRRRAPALVVQTSHSVNEAAWGAHGITVTYRLATPFIARTLLNVLAAASQTGTLTPRENTAMAIAKTALTGRHILVVDDNELNREVARDILSAEGARVTVSEDGEEAIAAVAHSREEGQTPIDAVLMDVQMPRLDGHSATRRLRADPVNYYLPIIALTAHGLIGERERSLAAGMNEHLTKPIALSQLLAALQRCLPPSATGHPAAPAATHQPAGPVLNIAPELREIDVRSALARLDGRIGSYLRLLRVFVAQAPRYSESYRLASTGSERARVAHDLKSSAGSLGFTRLSVLAAAHEARWETSPSAADPESVELLCAALAQTVVQAEQLLAANPDPAHKAPQLS